MGNEYFLQEEFKTHLTYKGREYPYSPAFYDSKILKINRHTSFDIEGKPFTDALKEAILSCNIKEIGNIFYSVFLCLDMQADNLCLLEGEFNALRLGILKYKFFIYNYSGLQTKLYIRKNIYSKQKRVKLSSFLKGKTRYVIPLYHENYVYKKSEVDELWRKIFNSKKEYENLSTLDYQGEQIDDEILLDYEIIVRKTEYREIEIVKGGNTLITLTLLYYVLSSFAVTKKITNKHVSLRINTALNQQDLYGKILKSQVNKKGVSPEIIIKELGYFLKDINPNTGFAFYQTIFRFTQLLRFSKIPQSKYYSPLLKDFNENDLKSFVIQINYLKDRNGLIPFISHKREVEDILMTWY